MVDGSYVLLERGAKIVADERHQRLKTAKPCADYEKVFRFELFCGKTFANRDGKSVHRQPDCYENQL